MTLLEFVLLFAIAGVCGALGQAIAGYSRGGCIVTIALGFIGALVGVWISRLLGLPEIIAIDLGPARFPIIWSIAGSAIFVALINFLGRRSRARKR